MIVFPSILPALPVSTLTLGPSASDGSAFDGSSVLDGSVLLTRTGSQMPPSDVVVGLSAVTPSSMTPSSVTPSSVSSEWRFIIYVKKIGVASKPQDHSVCYGRHFF